MLLSVSKLLQESEAERNYARPFIVNKYRENNKILSATHVRKHASYYCKINCTPRRELEYGFRPNYLLLYSAGYVCAPLSPAAPKQNKHTHNE
jgi:hypothetical protein